MCPEKIKLFKAIRPQPEQFHKGAGTLRATSANKNARMSVLSHEYTVFLSS